jgi:hypothetical protein
MSATTVSNLIQKKHESYLLARYNLRVCLLAQELAILPAIHKPNSRNIFNAPYLLFRVRGKG